MEITVCLPQYDQTPVARGEKNIIRAGSNAKLVVEQLGLLLVGEAQLYLVTVWNGSITTPPIPSQQRPTVRATATTFGNSHPFQRVYSRNTATVLIVSKQDSDSNSRPSSHELITPGLGVRIFF